MHDTQIIHAIAHDGYLRDRIDSIVRRRSTTATVSPVERLMLATVPLEAIAWEVACNPTVFTTVTGALDAEDPQVSAAVAEVDDGDLEYVVCQQITCLVD